MFAGKALPPITPPHVHKQLAKPQHHHKKAKAVVTVKTIPKLHSVTPKPTKTPGNPYFDYRGGLLRICGGTTPKGETEWKSYKNKGLVGLTLHVNIKMACQFNGARRAQYFSSLIQRGKPGSGEGFAASELAGTNYVYNSTQESFNVFVFHPLVENEIHLKHAVKHWQVSWVGAIGYGTGHTELHNVDWKQHSPTVLTSRVDTKAGHFTSSPRYVACLCAEDIQAPVMGTRSIYLPTAHSFHIYVHTKIMDITPTEADHKGWVINWIGSEEKNGWIGESAANWVTDQDTNKGAHTDIKTNSLGTVLPSFVASLQSSSMKWYEGDVGAGTLFGVKPSGFSLYIDQVRPGFLRAWNVTYIAYASPVDCQLSDWTAWGTCSATCGGGQTTKHRRIIVTPNTFGKACKTHIQKKPCNTKPCAKHCKLSPWSVWKHCVAGDCLQYVASRHRKILQLGRHCPPDLVQYRHNGFGKSRQCGAVVSNPQWHEGGAKSNSIYADIDTSACTFSSFPFYVATVAVDSPVVSIGVGTTSIARAHHNGFRLYVYMPGKPAQMMRTDATEHGWAVNWIADTGNNSGMTVPKKTGWAASGSSSLRAQVNTSACAFKRAPQYIVAVHTSNQALRAQGSHSVYRPALHGFDLLVTFPPESDIQPFQVEADLIAIVVWIGSTATLAQRSVSTWHGYQQDPVLAYTEVTAFAKVTPKHVPCYVVTLATQQPVNESASLFGGAAISDPDRNGFRVYIGPRGTTGNRATSGAYGKLTVNYIYFRGMHCEYTPWEPWGECSSTCKGTKMRHRSVLTVHRDYHCSGSLVDTSSCGVSVCPVDCRMSKWGEWSTCSKQCGKGSRKRVRSVQRPAASGGKQCPPLVGTESCDIGACIFTPSSAIVFVILGAVGIGATAFSDSGWAMLMKFCPHPTTGGGMQSEQKRGPQNQYGTSEEL
jgi:hypothetical protein